MEQLALKHKKLMRGLIMLQNGITQLSLHHELYTALRDSAIKRFEYCFDMLWKYCKLYVELKHGLSVPSSPRGVFAISRDIPIITREEYERLLKITDARNMTSHTYEESLAEEIAAAIPAYYVTMNEIALRLV